MGHLLYLMFRCDGDVMESLDFGWFLRDLNTPKATAHLTCRAAEDMVHELYEVATVESFKAHVLSELSC